MTVRTLPRELGFTVCVLFGETLASAFFCNCSHLLNGASRDVRAMGAPMPGPNMSRSCRPLMALSTLPQEFGVCISITVREAFAAISRGEKLHFVEAQSPRLNGTFGTPVAVRDMARSCFPYMPLGALPHKLGPAVNVFP
jgi:hypothetical protein